MSDSFRQCKMCDDLKLDKEFSFMEMVCRACYWKKDLKNNRKCEHHNPGAETDSDSGPDSPCPTLLSDRAKSPASLVTPVLTGRLSPHHSPVFCSNEMCRVKILAGKTRHPKTGIKWICQICRAYFMTYKKDRVSKEFQAMLDLVVFRDVPVFEDPGDEAGPAPRMLSPILVPSEVLKEHTAIKEHRAAPPPSNSYCAATVTGSSAIPGDPDVLGGVPAPQPPSKHVFLNDSPAPKASAVPKGPIVYKNALVVSSAPAPVDDEPPPQAPLRKTAPNLAPDKPTALVGSYRLSPQALSSSTVKSNFPVEYQPATGHSKSLLSSTSTSIEPEDCQESPLDLSSSSAPEKASRAPASPDDSSAKPSPLRDTVQANPNAVSVIRFAPKRFKTFIEPAPKCLKPFIEPALKSTKHFIGPAQKSSEPFIRPAPKTHEPFIGSASKSPKSFTKPAPISSKPFVESAPKRSKSFTGPAPKSSEPFIGPAPTPSKLITESAPKSSKSFIGSAQKSTEPFIEPAPGPSRPHAPPTPSTSAPGTSTSTATINRIQNLVTSIAPPPPPPETLVVPKIYSQIFHVCGNDGICMRPMARRVFVDMETGKKVCYSCIRKKPRSSRQLPMAMKKPRMEDNAKN
ncbi:hypothetical protein CAEBREN_23136 [Caenorhabditis brenneri]|uniref:Uncharacterized protein n=1 Tax=Caenorhabditis brenneri TaxID=135651 RepID=G0N340_CAEBE|nr:hypothetical protein CAEBREN_23136 [Caenorhabditis brenneri]